MPCCLTVSMGGSFTYIEPFVGGGAMLFHMLQRFPNITKVVINDINPYLTTYYRTVRNNLKLLIESLTDIENDYLRKIIIRNYPNQKLWQKRV